MELLLDPSDVEFPSTIVATFSAQELANLDRISYNTSGLSTGQYFWQVRAINVDNVASYSELRTFTVCVDIPPRTPVPVSPANETIDTNVFVSLQWLAMDQKAGDYGKQLNDITIRLITM